MTGEPPPKVLVVSHMYPSRVQPTDGIFIHHHVRALLREGEQVRVVAPVPWAPRFLWVRERWRAYGKMLCEPEQHDGVPVRRIPYLHLPQPAAVWGGLGLALSLKRVLPSIRHHFPFDVLHAHTLTPDGWGVCLAARRERIPVICSIRGSDLNEYPYESRLLMRASCWVLRQSAGIVTVSGALAQRARELGGAAVDPQVICNGVDLDRFHAAGDRRTLREELGLPVGRQVILFVGRFAADKGIRELLQAFGSLVGVHDNAHLVLVGHGPLSDEVRRAASAGPLAGRLTTPGRLDHDRVADYCRASDVFVLPTYMEGMPNALLEAMACQLACVASRVGGIPEAIKDGISGLLIEPRSVESLKLALDRLLSSRELARQLGEAAAKVIRERFSWRTNALLHRALYRKVRPRTLSSPA